jgi:hypothetical protein
MVPINLGNKTNRISMSRAPVIGIAALPNYGWRGGSVRARFDGRRLSQNRTTCGDECHIAVIKISCAGDPICTPNGAKRTGHKN